MRSLTHDEVVLILKDLLLLPFRMALDFAPFVILGSVVYWEIRCDIFGSLHLRSTRAIMIQFLLFSAKLLQDFRASIEHPRRPDPPTGFFLTFTAVNNMVFWFCGAMTLSAFNGLYLYSAPPRTAIWAIAFAAATATLTIFPMALLLPPAPDMPTIPQNVTLEFVITGAAYLGVLIGSYVGGSSVARRIHPAPKKRSTTALLAHSVAALWLLISPSLSLMQLKQSKPTNYDIVLNSLEDFETVKDILYIATTGCTGYLALIDILGPPKFRAGTGAAIATSAFAIIGWPCSAHRDFIWSDFDWRQFGLRNNDSLKFIFLIFWVLVTGTVLCNIALHMVGLSYEPLVIAAEDCNLKDVEKHDSK